MALCLIVEDSPGQAAILHDLLQVEGHQVRTARTGAAALDLARRDRPEVVLLDLGLPDADGIDLIPRLLGVSPYSRVIVISGRDSVKSAVAALRAGARHYLVKPWEDEELLLVIGREGKLADLFEKEQRVDPTGAFWGTHPSIRQVRVKLEKLARAPLTPVLIEGETGTGKEVFARELHSLTAVSGLFVALNCAAIPSELLESELFGHERGAFTGAEARRRGLAELARDGTLFLDEIGEMAPPLQTKLLRFLEDHRFRRVGGEEEVASPCRVVAATHRDLEKLQADGVFRSDLFFRLAVVRLGLVPLRERRDDILPLAYFLLERLSRSLGKAPRQLSVHAERALAAHAWPGNIRELRNRLERALVLGEGSQIEPEDLDLRLGDADGAEATGVAGEARRLQEALDLEGWNVSLASRRLGVPRHWLRYRMQKYGLTKPVG